MASLFVSDQVGWFPLCEGEGKWDFKINNNVDFLYLLADAAAAAFQYGFPDDLCSPLVDAKTNGKDLLFWFRCYGTVHNSGATSETTYHRPHWLVAFTMFSQSL
ncbi:hypothetical protein BHE74_00039303 [Ensete ventricosum]|nr:hypothetical protein BHE74_00039303 [Ensete ventricosum]